MTKYVKVSTRKHDPPTYLSSALKEPFSDGHIVWGLIHCPLVTLLVATHPSVKDLARLVGPVFGLDSYWENPKIAIRGKSGRIIKCCCSGSHYGAARSIGTWCIMAENEPWQEQTWMRREKRNESKKFWKSSRLCLNGWGVKTGHSGRLTYCSLTKEYKCFVVRNVRWKKNK